MITGRTEEAPVAEKKKDVTKKPARRVEASSEPEKPRLYVGNLNYDTTDADLESLFGEHGTVASAAVVTHGRSGKSKGFAFVEMSRLEDAKTAVEKLHGTDFQGRTIIVSEAKSQKPERTEAGDRREPRERGEPRERRDSGDRSESGERRPSRREGERGERRGRDRSRGGDRQPDPAAHLKPKALEVETVNSPSLVVGSVSGEATDQDITEIFSGIGTVQNRTEIGEPESGAATREFRVDLADTAEAQKAVELLNGKSFMGHRLRVTEAKD